MLNFACTTGTKERVLWCDAVRKKKTTEFLKTHESTQSLKWLLNKKLNDLFRNGNVKEFQVCQACCFRKKSFRLSMDVVCSYTRITLNTFL